MMTSDQYESYGYTGTKDTDTQATGCVIRRCEADEQLKIISKSTENIGIGGDKARGFRSSSLIIIITRPPSSSSLKVTDRSFRYASPSLWNNLPALFRQPRSSSVTTITRSITPSITSSLFYFRLKTHLFHKSFPPQTLYYPPNCPLDFNRTAFTDSALCFSSYVIFFQLTRVLVCRTKLAFSQFLITC